MVGVILIVIAGLILMFAGNVRRTTSLFPKKTIEVLRADQALWNQGRQRS